MPGTARPKVVIADTDFPTSEFELRELARIDAEVTIGQCKTEQAVIDLCAEADGIILQYAPMTRRVFDHLPRCRVVSRYGVGVDTIDIPAATDHGIWVGNVRNYCTPEVAEHTLALVFACARRLFQLDRAVHGGFWNTVKTCGTTHLLSEQTLGLIGFGDTGKAVADRARLMGLRVLVYSPHSTPEMAAEHGAERVDLPELLRQSDYVSLHMTLNAQTRHIVDAGVLAQMKPTAYLVNTSRGGLVSNADLYQALVGGKIAGAALDVLEKEPVEPDNPLLGLPNVMITAHAAWFSSRALENLLTLTARNVVAVLSGEPPLYPVNRPENPRR